MAFTKDGFYGNGADSNTFTLKHPNGKDTNKYFTLVNKKTGEIEVYQDERVGNKRVGTIGADGKMKYNDAWYAGVRETDRKTIENGLPAIKNHAITTAKTGIINEKGLDAGPAGAEARKLTKGIDQAISDSELGQASRPANIGLGKEAEPIAGTKESGFGIHVFPTSLRTNKGGQDFLKIDMMKFIARDLTGAVGGVGGKKHLGIEQRQSDRESIGTVILPCPGGLRDSQQVTWQEDSMNPWQLAIANIALNLMDNPDKGVEVAGSIVETALGTPDTRDAVAKYMAGQAANVQNLQTRTTGAILNPNMELLFSTPKTRNFTFAFTLAPRSQNEAMTIIKIIRFFKQGMAPIRSKSRLFLKSPHTFRLAYKRNAQSVKKDHSENGIGIKDHPYLNQFKECALSTFSVDYTPNGQYSTYEDGVMTAYSVTMNFQELNPIYNDDYGAVPSDGLPAEIGF